ncbi:MAG: hypothetical protein AAF642_05775, partial [Pseudomonadota bacterium]
MIKRGPSAARVGNILPLTDNLLDWGDGAAHYDRRSNHRTRCGLSDNREPGSEAKYRRLHEQTAGFRA